MFTDLKQYDALQQTNFGYWFNPEGILTGENVTWSPIPENETQLTIIPRSLILHTNAGSSPATWQQLKQFIMSPGQTTDCHFDVDNSGQAGQFLSVLVRADCNFDANGWVHEGKRYGGISIESGDEGAATVEKTPWNLAQLHTICSIATALAAQYGTGCGEVLTWNGSGIDYHTKFPYVNSSVKAWTNSRGKTCPGLSRKRQLPWIRQEVANRIGAYINKCSEFGVSHGIPGL